MKVLIVSQAEVPVLLPMGPCIDLMANAFRSLSEGQAVMPLRSKMAQPDGRGILVTMPTYLAGAGLGLKLLTIFPENHGTEYDAHQGAVILCEPERGRLLAIMDATAITAIRTAAASALAARLLAREGAGDLAIIGSGVQAESHLEAMIAVRPIRRVRVYSRTPDNAAVFAARAAKRYGLPVLAVQTAEEAVRGADLVVTATSATEPILRGEWLAPGAHITSVGGVLSTACELDGATMQQARIFTDRRESWVNESGNFLRAQGQGLINESHLVGEIGDLLLGKLQGRRTEQEITLFDSLGLAIEDLAAARYIYDRAIATGAGTQVELGGSRHVGH